MKAVANRAIVQHVVNAMKDFVERVIIAVGAPEETVTCAAGAYVGARDGPLLRFGT